jgi:hypothetical protein
MIKVQYASAIHDASGSSPMPRYRDFEITLKHIDPPIWRRFLLTTEDTTFLDLHNAIQEADTWMDMHLWAFRESARGGQLLAVIPPNEEMGIDELVSDGPSADEVLLSTFFDRQGQSCVYTYDFGDGWEHTVVLKQIVDKPETFHRRLIDGGRAFPPEDCGGPPGYELCLALVDPAKAPHVDLSDFDEEELEDRRTWLGEWDPEAFDLEQEKQWFDAESRQHVKQKQQMLMDAIDRALDELNRSDQS